MSRINIGGFGTGNVEQASSLAIRYAEALNVRFIDFYRYAIFPQSGRHAKTAYMQIPRRLYTEGMTTTALEWVLALATLMRTSDVQYCTTLPLQGAISGRGLNTDERRWCPQCLDEMADSGEVIYEPLVWRMCDACCTVHATALASVCPLCKRGAQTFLVPNARVGCCRHCGAWLGHPKAAMERAVDERQISASRLCSELVLLPQLLGEHEALVPSKVAVQALWSHFFDASSERMGQAIGETAARIRCYLRGDLTAPLSVIVRLALVTQTTMRQIFVTQEFLDSGSGVTVEPSVVSSLHVLESPSAGRLVSDARNVDDGTQGNPPSSGDSSTSRKIWRWRRRNALGEQAQVRARNAARQAVEKKVSFAHKVKVIVADLKTSGAPQPSIKAVKQLISSRGPLLNPWERMIIASRISQVYSVGESAISDGPSGDSYVQHVNG
ncbi:TniQ family protein [Paraburkholderia pallida]|uniref:TniQ domain-containing protein n=1 Tax=Paraburkholderia pallida TaxID=2547399 RepID=A0A4P7D586_9BURK|nr:TniQ family protein [Paraburkholderia pallida]QBR02507.1 hypothetical protein E1956_35290 [Paraburkholderia pallida]